MSTAPSSKGIPPWVLGVIGVILLGIFCAALGDPGHHLPFTPGYGSPAPSASPSVTPHK